LLPVFRQLSLRPRKTVRDLLAAMGLAWSIGGPSIVEDLAQSWALLRRRGRGARRNGHPQILANLDAQGDADLRRTP
jgi:hypothetical protein